MIVIVNYGVGNLTSIQNMIKKGGVTALISGRKEEIEAADKIVLPGMGHFDNCMEKFNGSGVRPILEKRILEDKIPVLGICVGLQMLMETSQEGVLPGLGWIKGHTVRFDSSRMHETQKIPNMGWLETKVTKHSLLMESLERARFYFAHSYHVKVANLEDQLLGAHYGYDFTAGIEFGNICGVQFHPEKSHKFGLKLMSNFISNY